MMRGFLVGATEMRNAGEVRSLNRPLQSGPIRPLFVRVLARRQHQMMFLMVHAATHYAKKAEAL
jgi:hypothetical protein